MPITEFQTTVLQLLKQHRNPNSYVAGGVAINRESESPRLSNDIDFFHDTSEAVLKCSNFDLTLLGQSGYEIKYIFNQPGYVQVLVSKNNNFLKLEWVRDTAFRFFPVIEDDILGYRLHDYDLAINKCLALANRNEVRDIIDLLFLDKNKISLAASCWAACGKDPGFTPELLFDCMRKNSIIRSEQVDAESLISKISPVELKKEWLELLNSSIATLNDLPANDLGCLYIDQKGEIVSDLRKVKLAQYQKHFGSIGGCWPSLT